MKNNKQITKDKNIKENENGYSDDIPNEVLEEVETLLL
jgi:hypothetical protein